MFRKLKSVVVFLKIIISILEFIGVSVTNVWYLDLYCVTLCMCSLVFVAVSEVQMSRQTKLEIA